MEPSQQDDDRSGVTTAIVRALVRAQFPAWAGLEVRPAAHGGWDNRTFHLGEDLLVRVPSAERYVEQVAKEHRWLPVLAGYLPVPIPVPVAKGTPAPPLERPWSVYRWLPGHVARPERIRDLDGFAVDVADVLLALHAAPADGGPPPGTHNFFRGSPERLRRGHRAGLSSLQDRTLAARLAQVWEEAMGTQWRGAPVWIHGDVGVGNLLVDDRGALCAVIDFGGCGVGDPSCDLALAWTALTGSARERFRERLALDDGTWARGRAWALWKAVVALARDEVSPEVQDEALRQLGEIANDGERHR